MKFTEEHEWLALDGDVVTVGITAYAVEQLGDIVFVELPEKDTEFAAGDEAGVVESVKAASDVYAPVSGTIAEVNEAISENPNVVNDDPLGEGWFFKIRMNDLGEYESFMDEEEYNSLIQ